MDNKFGKSLIDCVKLFERGVITISDKTNKRVYLSNGTSFDKNLWFQTKNIFQYVLNDLESEHEPDNSVRLNLKEIEMRKIKNMEHMLEGQKKRLNETVNLVAERQVQLEKSLVEYTDLLFSTMSTVLPTGNYANRKVCDVFATNPQYIRWIFKNVEQYKKLGEADMSKMIVSNH